MGKISIDTIKKLRENTGAGVMEVKKALEESKGNEKQALEWIQKKGLAKAEKRAGHEAGQGVIASYVHHGGKIGVLVEIRSETDFVARNEEFYKLGNEIAMQVASMNPKDIKELLTQDSIRDPRKKIGEMVTELSAKTGEKIEVSRFVRFELGEK